MDPYRVLGVVRDATDDQIRAGYRTLVKVYHPDLHPGDPTAAAGILRVNAAFEAIGEPDARAVWDAAHPMLNANDWKMTFAFVPPPPANGWAHSSHPPPTAQPMFRRRSLPVRLLRDLGMPELVSRFWFVVPLALFVIWNDQVFAYLNDLFVGDLIDRVWAWLLTQ